MSHVSVPGSMPSCVRARTFVGQRPRDRGRVALTRIRFPRAGRGAGATSGSPALRAVLHHPATATVALADARAGRDERRQRKRWCGSRPRLGRRAGARPPPASAAARRVIAARDPAPEPNGHVDNAGAGCVTATGRRRRRNRPGSCQEPSTGRPASPSAPVSIATTGSGPANDRPSASGCPRSCPVPPTLPRTMPPSPPVTTTTPRGPGLRPFRDA